MSYRQKALKLYKLTFSLSKSFYIFAILRALAQTAKAFVGVYGLKLIIDSLLKADYNQALISVGIVISLEIICHMLFLTFDISLINRTEYLIRRVKEHLSKKLMNTEFKYLEDPKYLDIADKSIFAIENFGALDNYLNATIELFSNFLIVLTLLSILIYFNPLILIIITIAVLFNRIILKRSSKKQIKKFDELGPINRKYTYYSRAVSDIKYAKEFAFYPLSDLIYENSITYLEETSKFMTKFYLIIAKYQSYATIVNSLQVALLYLAIGYLSISQGFGISSYVFVTTSAIKVSSSVNLFINGFVRIRENTQLLAPIIEVDSFEDAITRSNEGILAEPLHSLEFKNVSFSYPSNDTIILDDVSFTITQGEKVSIVGLNGAGKTTLVKLICRFYTPTKGQILWNGVDINNYQFESYINQIAAVFQDFKLFALTLFENVDMSQIDEKKVNECFDKVGLKEKINRLPNGINTYLSKQYYVDGTELSGGELQKVAIARAMYKKSSLNILDEPTSALDPLSEAEVYDNFAKLVEGTTTLYISHRMSSSVFCDRIIVLNNKKIEAIDSHKNLIKNHQGKYYELFNYQKEYYVE
ncbi:MAG: ABC transporter ATP-binding protein [Bacilli bacterium]|nr:ABC transporter ATP-binding protein [Bacilli bacterium]